MTPMAAPTAGVNRPGATADLGTGGPPAARTTGPAGEDRSAAVSSGTRTVTLATPSRGLASPFATLTAVRDLLIQRVARRNLSPKILDFGKVEPAARGTVRQTAKLRQGIEQCPRTED